MSRRDYVNAVVRNYVRLPDTPFRASRGDRRFAGILYDRHVPLRVVYSAFVLAVARREIRPPDEPRHPAIRTLHYFTGVIDEILHTPPEDGYIRYLASKIQPLVDQKDVVLSTGRRISAVSDYR